MIYVNSVRGIANTLTTCEAQTKVASLESDYGYINDHGYVKYIYTLSIWIIFIAVITKYDNNYIS